MRLSVLGPPGLVRDDGTPAGLAPGKTFAVLVYLAHEGSPPSRTDLARLFWPDSEPARARQSVRQTLSLIRKVLGEDAFASEDPVKLRPGAVDSDVRAFLEALRDGEVEAADALWRGPFGDGLALADAPEWTHWLEDRQLALEGRLCETLTAAAEAARFRSDAGAGETAEEAIGFLRRAIEIDPYRERPRAVLVDLLEKQGRPDEAANELAEARRALGEETPGLRALAARVDDARRRRYAAGEADPAAGLGGIFVGRAAEMGRLLGAWARVEEGVPATAIVSGPAGIGKTRLASEVAEHARRRGGIVAFTSPLPVEAEIEAGVLRDLIGQLSDGIARAGSRTGRGAGRVPRAAPGVGTGVGASSGAGSGTGSEPGSGAGGGDDPRNEVAAAEHFLALLRRLPAPALLVVDDVQWVDPFSRSVLGRVQRHFTSGPCLFLGTLRPEATDRAMRETVRSVLDAPGSVGIELGPLSDDEVRELVALAARIDQLEAAGALDRILAAAGGNPLYVVELLRTLAETGMLASGDTGQLQLSGTLPDPLPLPNGVRELLERRLEALPDDAIAVATQLAAAGGRLDVDRLRDATGLPTPEFSRGLGALLERDLLRWAAPAELAFAHEEVRRSAARRFPLASDEAARRAKRRGRRLGWAAMALASVPLLALAATRAWRGPEPAEGPAAPPYGGGSLVLVSDREIVELRPTAGPAATWPRSSVPLPAPELAEHAGPFLTTSGERVLYGRVLAEGAPPRIVRVDADGSLADVARSDWDEGSPWLSPDGRSLAWEHGRVEGDRHPHEVRVAGADGAGPRTVLRREAKVALMGWAPSGRFLLVAVGAADGDSLLAVTPRGERRAGWAFEEDIEAAWCGQTDRFAVTGVRDGARGLWLGSPAQADLEPVSAGEVLPYPVACSPDASGIAYARALDGRLRLVVLDVATGRFEPLPPELDARVGLAWLPDSLAPVPVAVEIAPDSVVLDWGDTLRVGAAVARSDGSQGADRLAWRSADPAVVSVRPDGTLTGNGPGRAVVFARADGWLEDSVLVAVRATERPDVLLREDFATLDPERWIVYGAPQAEAVRRGDTTALALRGDGVFHDGILSRVPFSLRGGATLELAFRLPLRGTRGQRVQVCLEDAGPDLSAWKQVRFVPAPRERACLTWPAAELERLRPDEAAVSAAGWRRTVRLPDDLPSDGWVRVGVQVRGDGMPFFSVNGRLVAAGPLQLAGLDRPTWHVNLAGKSVGTELLVRRLVVWRGARFIPLAWSVEPVDNVSNLYTVWASSESDVWVAGGHRFLRRFDGTAWTAPALPPGTQNTSRLFGFPGGPVFLAGQHGVDRFDGSGGRKILDGVGELFGIWGSAPSDLYVAGDGRFLHFDGRRWTEIPTGLSTELYADRLETVWGTATDDVYVGGYHGRILHWDGARLEETVLDPDENVHAIHGSGPGDVFAVGTNGRIWHYDGSSWSRMESDTRVKLSGVSAISPREVYVTGDRGTLLLWDGTSWTPASSGTSRDLSGIFTLSPNRVYVAARQGALLIGTR